MNSVTKLFIILFFITTTLKSQENIQEVPGHTSDTTNSEMKLKIQDTLCFRLNFVPGDTLIYKFESYDSLIHNMDKPILKKRTEDIMLVCDSVDGGNNFHLRYKVLNVEQKEWTATTDTVERTGSPWIGKETKLVIDSVGRRLFAKNLDSNFIVSSLGGSFQPYLFFPFDNSCKKIGESWLVQSSDTLCENSYPPATINQTSLFRLKDKLMNESDTLAFITFVKTAQGLYGFETEDISISVQNILNIYGEIKIDLKNNVPQFFYTTQEEKIHILRDDGSKIPAWHFANVTFELIKLNRDENKIKSNIKKLRNELKKRK